MKGERFVLDTNVLISAALSVGSPPNRLTSWVITSGRLIFSDPTFEEFRTRLWRPKFDRYLTIERRNLILHDFSALADWVDCDDIDVPTPSRDSDDDKFIATAIASSARWLISGDKDLLDLDPPTGIQILPPAAMLELIGRSEQARLA